MKKIMGKIDSIVQNPYEYLSNLSKSRKIMGYSCTYAPLEIIHAGGFHPARIIGLSSNISLSDIHLQSYACAIVRTLLEDSLSKKLDFLNAFLFLHTCDSMQKLSDIFRMRLSFKHFDLILPVKFNTQSSKEYFVDILEDFKTKLEREQNIKISTGKLNESIQIYNNLRKNLLDLYNIKSTCPFAITYADLSKIVKASFIMDPLEFIDISSSIIKNITLAPANKTKRIILSGSICVHPDIFGTIENKNASIVWDDLCSGTRFFEQLVEQTGKPINALADRFIKRPICPTKYVNPSYRLDYLKKIIENHNANGVIFLFIKFCEPHSFDYPDQKKTLEKVGIPSILIEIENQNVFDEQTKTRLETFIEMLGD
ncbi:Benzoyl-CoA reductase subunit BadD [Desulfurella amilsii]|uniref:Benzoyl-CoA reductase subunit BadD n=1 Tax=Desulfurella amilsii TaxID=1562698 RepID=A0A1X4XUF1_9BACT|nr:2-hydroxyacyl-CoA dehydratase family protein [Desulfurella amilsii]OSS41165.1 Benzoyl-CoA reductase subunit BadD [Desulfurella amilsii]